MLQRFSIVKLIQTENFEKLCFEVYMDAEDIAAIVIILAVSWKNPWLPNREQKGSWHNICIELQLRDQDEFRKYLRINT